jgi:signal transduction histidine kinase
MPKRAADIALIVGLAALYLALARVGLSLDAVAGFATLVWPPTGLALAALLLFGYRAWPGIFIGAFTANLLTGAPVPVALGIGVGNTAEALACAYLVQRLPRFTMTLESVRSVMRLILAAVLGTMISATIGVASLYAGGIVASHQLRESWMAWWIGDMVGALVVAPIILVWSTAPRARFRPGRTETAFLVVALSLVSVSTFFDGVRFVPSFPTPFHQTDVLLAVLIWAALRFGQRGSVTAAFLVSATAVTATTLGFGPFVQPELRLGLLSLQTFMAIVIVTCLLLGATIAERRCVHEIAREAHRAAIRANRAKSEFLAVMSHELRTPLNAIAGYSQLLEDGIYGPLNEKQTDGVARIHRNEQQLLEIIDEVLGFVSAETGHVTVQSAPVHVIEVLDVVAPLMEPELQRKQASLKRDDIRSGLTVRADPKSLQQILLRLLSNAAKYTDEGGMVTIGAEREGKTIRIWVRDTGAGIPQAEIDHVFEPFFQAEHATTRRVSGIGLGLTIARDLARRMEGEVTLASKVGTGTTASVILPAA